MRATGEGQVYEPSGGGVLGGTSPRVGGGAATYVLLVESPLSSFGECGRTSGSTSGPQLKEGNTDANYSTEGERLQTRSARPFFLFPLFFVCVLRSCEATDGFVLTIIYYTHILW